MSQKFLGPNPGTPVRDYLALHLLDLNAAASTTVGDVKVSGWPHKVVFELVLGTLTGTGLDVDVEVEGADNLAFDSGVVSYGHFDAIGASDDGETRHLEAEVYKPYLRATATISGSGPAVTLDLYVRPPHTDRATTRTA